MNGEAKLHDTVLALVSVWTENLLKVVNLLSIRVLVISDVFTRKTI